MPPPRGSAGDMFGVRLPPRRPVRRPPHGVPPSPLPQVRAAGYDVLLAAAESLKLVPNTPSPVDFHPCSRDAMDWFSPVFCSHRSALTPDTHSLEITPFAAPLAHFPSSHLSSHSKRDVILKKHRALFRSFVCFFWCLIWSFLRPNIPHCLLPHRSPPALHPPVHPRAWPPPVGPPPPPSLEGFGVRGWLRSTRASP